MGGYAVAFHAKPRYTKDIAVFIDRADDNVGRLLAALDDFGFGSLGLSASDFTVPDQIIQLGFAPNRIDILTSLAGVTFEEAWSGRVSGRYGAQAVNYIGRAELIRNKQAAGRDQDLMDVRWLTATPDGEDGRE